MRKFAFLGFGLFAAGFGMKFFHTPFHALIMFSGLIALLIENISYPFQEGKSKSEVCFRFGITFTLSYLLFLVKFYPLGLIPLSIGLLCFVLGVFYAQNTKSNNPSITRFTIVTLVLSILVSATVYLIPSDVRYYLFNIKFNHEIETDYRTWDKYSWFLYVNDKHAEAAQASERALELVSKTTDKQSQNQIKSHRSKINDRSWKRFNH